jgi:hypothetical protein
MDAPVRFAPLVLGVLLLTRCGGPPTVTPVGPAGEAGAVPPAPAGATAAGPPPLTVAIASSDLAVGADRFAFGLFDPAQRLIEDAAVEVTFFHLGDEVAAPVEKAEAAFYPSVIEPAGLYVVNTTFDRPGEWGAEIRARLPDESEAPSQRVRFTVKPEPAAPGIGDAPPPTANRTLATEPDLAKLTSDPQPDPDLYGLTVDQAAASGRPTVVVFSTPGHCQSRVCGPVLDEVKAEKAKWSDRVNFVHIEVYKTFDPLVLADEMAAWGLQTEPWVFVLGADGRVVARLEGNITAAELEPILERVSKEAS